MCEGLTVLPKEVKVVNHHSCYLALQLNCSEVFLELPEQELLKGVSDFLCKSDLFNFSSLSDMRMKSLAAQISILGIGPSAVAWKDMQL